MFSPHVVFTMILLQATRHRTFSCSTVLTKVKEEERRGEMRELLRFNLWQKFKALDIFCNFCRENQNEIK
jgi:hypothetical protein